MKEQFADYQTSKMLKELGFDEKCMQIQHPNLEKISFSEARLCSSDLPSDVIAIPNWQQAKEWLFKKHKRVFHIEYCSEPEDYLFKVWDGLYWHYRFNSPIEAEIEGIKASIKYLHKQITK